MKANPEIVLISHWFGHTPHCLECIVPFFLERGYTIYHLTDKPEAAATYFSETGLLGHEKIRHREMVKVEAEKPNWRRDEQLCRVEAHWQGVGLALERLYRELGRKVGIFHTWVDLYSHEYLDRRVIEAAMPAPWVGLYVHPAELRIFKTWKRRVYENAMDLIKKGQMFPSRLRAFNVPNARKIYFLDEEMPKRASKFFTPQTGLGFFPEYTLPLSVPESFNFAEVQNFCRRSGKVLGLLGFLSKRKGLLTVARVAKKEILGWSFIFAGKIDWNDFDQSEKHEIQDFISNPTSNSLVIPRSLTDGEFNFVLNSADILYIAYENFFHSSGIQFKAACLKKPVISGPMHLLAERTRKFQLGWCLPEISSAELFLLLDQLGREDLEKMVAEAKFYDFLDEHSPEILQTTLSEISKLIQK